MRKLYRMKQAGFTLIEIIIATLIFSILGIAVSKLLSHVFNTYTVGNNINQLSTQTLSGIERIAYDLRNASSLTTIAANSFTFIDQAGNSYTYQLSGNNLQRGSYTVIDSVSSLVFTYWDANGSVTATPAAVEYVKIALTLTNDNTPVSFSTVIAMRGIY